MELKFTNKQIYFTLESIWQNLDYRFKYQIHNLVILNSDEEFEQNIDIDISTLMKCYQAMSSGAYGCTVDMAQILLDSLRTQLIQKSNIVEYETYKASLESESPLEEVIPNEYTLSLLEIKKYKEQDQAMETAKIINGKTQILL